MPKTSPYENGFYWVRWMAGDRTMPALYMDGLFFMIGDLSGGGQPFDKVDFVGPRIEELPVFPPDLRAQSERPA